MNQTAVRTWLAGNFFLGVVGRDTGVPDNATLCMTGIVAGEEVFFNGNQNIS